MFVRDGHLCPVEVMSSSYRTHKSLDMLKEKYSVKTKERVVLYTKDITRADDVAYLPLYMAMCL